MDAPCISSARARATAVLALLALGPLLACAKDHYSPVEDNTPGHLSLTVTIPCPTVSTATVYVDERAVGDMKIPGAFFVDVPVGSHTFRIGPAYPGTHPVGFQSQTGFISAYTNPFACPPSP